MSEILNTIESHRGTWIYIATEDTEATEKL